MTSERSEIEALAYCYGVEMLDPHGRKTWEFDGRGLHELARRLQPARVPESRLIGWRSADYTMETDDPDMARNWAGNIEVLPIFEGDPNTKLAAAPAAEGGLADPVAWMTDSVFVCRSITEEKDVADMWLERGWNVFPLGVIDHAEPTPDSRSPDASASRKHDPWCSVLSWAHSSSTECDCSLSSAPAPESREADEPVPACDGDLMRCTEHSGTCAVCKPEAGQREGVEALEICRELVKWCDENNQGASLWFVERARRLAGK